MIVTHRLPALLFVLAIRVLSVDSFVAITAPGRLAFIQ
jgi:hypothetical protein